MSYRRAKARLCVKVCRSSRCIATMAERYTSSRQFVLTSVVSWPGTQLRRRGIVRVTDPNIAPMAEFIRVRPTATFHQREISDLRSEFSDRSPASHEVDDQHDRGYEQKQVDHV